MSTLELQEKLVTKVRTTNDENVLSEVYRLLELEDSTEEVYKLTPEQDYQISLSIKEMEEGKLLTDDEVNKEIEVWLNK
jgi:hypothetical protein